MTDHCPILPPAIIFVLDQSGVLFESGKVLNVLHSACSLIVDVSRVCPISTQHCPNPFPLSRRHRTHPQHRHHQLHNKTIQHNNKHHYNHRQPPQGNTLTKNKTHEFSDFLYSSICRALFVKKVFDLKRGTVDKFLTHEFFMFCLIVCSLLKVPYIELFKQVDRKAHYNQHKI